MPKLTKSGEAISLLHTNPNQWFTPTGVAQALAITSSQAQEILEGIEAEGKVESAEFGEQLQTHRYRWVVD